MSEQPQYPSYQRSQQGTEFETVPNVEQQIDLHMARDDLRPQAVIEAQRSVAQSYPMPSLEKNGIEPSAVALAARQLAHLQQVRVERMRPEDTPFLREAS